MPMGTGLPPGTAAGKQQLEAESGEYRRMTSAIDVLLKEA